MKEIVLAPDFLDDFLSAEFRVPVTLLQTNACSPLATNAIGGNIWDNFSSQTYRACPRSARLPSTTRSPVRPASIQCRPTAAATPARRR